MTKVNRRRVRRDWGRVMEDFRGSGMAVAGYCRKHGISRGLFDKWRKRLDEAAGQKQNHKLSDFVRVDVVPQSQMQLTIKFPGGVEVAVGNDCDVEILHTAITQLRGDSC